MMINISEYRIRILPRVEKSKKYGETLVSRLCTSAPIRQDSLFEKRLIKLKERINRLRPSRQLTDILKALYLDNIELDVIVKIDLEYLTREKVEQLFEILRI